MIRSGNDIFSALLKTGCVLILLFGLFGMVWLRSSMVTVSYDLRTLEEKKMEALKETKMLLAEKSKAVSVANIGADLKGRYMKEKHLVAANGLVFPDRVKVIQLKRHLNPETIKASLDIEK